MSLTKPDFCSEWMVDQYSKAPATDTNNAAWKGRLTYKPNINPVGAPREEVITVNKGAERTE